MKSAHALGSPFALRPPAGAREGRGRRGLVGLALIVVLAAGAAGLTLLPRSPSNPGGGGQAVSSGLAHGYRSPLGWSIRYPSGMHVEHASANGMSYAVDEVTFSSFRSRHGVLRREFPSGETTRTVPPRARVGGFPARGIAVRILWLVAGLYVPAGRTTQLPLKLSSFRTGGSEGGMYPGTRPRPLQHLLYSRQGRYFVQVWIGPKASARQRSLLGRMIASIPVQRPRS